MHQDIYPVQWTGRQAVVALPEHIDLSNADQIREELLSVINRGAAALVVDMTATISCDHAGADAVLRAHQRAVVSGTELRLVVTAKIVRRLLSLRGIDRLVSIYPSLEAAAAAGPLAAVLALVGAPAGARANGAPHRAARAGRQLPAAGPSDEREAAITPAVVWKLLDAMPDGVALADPGGALALANRRLAEMFGYERAELLGHPVEYLIPPHLQDARRSRLVGVRKDATTFPVEISHSPVTTAAGHFALTVIRDVTDARRLEVLADLACAAATAQQAQRGEELLDTIVTSLFHVGLSLQTAINLSGDAAGQRIAAALRQLDETIRQIRDAAFTTRSHETPAHPALQ